MTSNPLTSKQRKHLVRLGTHLKPILVVGKEGVTDAVLTSLEQCFRTRELVKARIRVDDPEARRYVAESLADAVGAALVQVLGKNALIYRRATDGIAAENRAPSE